MINMKRKAQAIPVMPTTYSTTKTNTSTLVIHGNNTHFVQSLSLRSIKINKQIKQILTYPLKYISMMFIPSIWNVHAKYCGNQRINRDAYSSRIQKELQLQQNRKKKKKRSADYAAFVISNNKISVWILQQKIGSFVIRNLTWMSWFRWLSSCNQEKKTKKL